MRSLLMLPLGCLVAVATLPAQSSLPYDVPQGWTSTQDAQTHLISLTPPGLHAPHFGVITVFTPEAFAGSEREFHDLIVRRATSQARVLQSPEQGTVGVFLVTSIHQQMPNGLHVWSRIYTARWADRGQVFILAADGPESLTQF